MGAGAWSRSAMRETAGTERDGFDEFRAQWCNRWIRRCIIEEGVAFLGPYRWRQLPQGPSLALTVTVRAPERECWG